MPTLAWCAVLKLRERQHACQWVVASSQGKRGVNSCIYSPSRAHHAKRIYSDRSCAMLKLILECVVVAGLLAACGGTPDYVALEPAQQKAVQAELGYLSKIVEITRWSVNADKVEIFLFRTPAEFEKVMRDMAGRASTAAGAPVVIEVSRLKNNEYQFWCFATGRNGRVYENTCS